MTVLGHRLDSTTSEVFYNLIDSLILQNIYFIWELKVKKKSFNLFCHTQSLGGKKRLTPTPLRQKKKNPPPKQKPNQTRLNIINDTPRVWQKLEWRTEPGILSFLALPLLPAVTCAARVAALHPHRRLPGAGREDRDRVILPRSQTTSAGPAPAEQLPRLQGAAEIPDTEAGRVCYVRVCLCVMCSLCVYTAMPRSAPAPRSPVPPHYLYPHVPGPASRGNLPQPAGPSRWAAGQGPGSAGQAVTAAAMAPAAALTGWQRGRTEPGGRRGARCPGGHGGSGDTAEAGTGWALHGLRDKGAAPRRHRVGLGVPAARREGALQSLPSPGSAAAGRVLLLLPLWTARQRGIGQGSECHPQCLGAEAQPRRWGLQTPRPPFFLPSFLPSLPSSFLPSFPPSLPFSLSPSLLSSHPAPPLGSPRPPPRGAPIGRAPPTWASRRARDAGERCRCQRRSARGGVGSARLLSVSSAGPIPKETGADFRRATGNNGLPGCHRRTGWNGGIVREHCACAGELLGAAAHPLGLRPLEPSGNGGSDGGPGWSRGKVAVESFSGPCRGRGADLQPPARPVLPRPVLPLPPLPRGGVFPAVMAQWVLIIRRSARARRA